MAARNASQPDPEAFASRMESALVAQIGAARFQMWFGASSVLFVPGHGDVIVAVASEEFHKWLEPTFGSAIRAAAQHVMGGEAKVRFVTDAELFKPRSIEPVEPEDLDPPPGKKLFDNPPAKSRKPKEGPTRRWKTLADFVVGASNRVAHAAALSAVEHPTDCGNPLVLHGPVGTGKTHLLEGIYLGLRRAHPESKPRYITAEEFTTRFVQASRFEKHDAFRRQFRDCDALLIDDLHFFATKPGTQREFVHTLDSLVADGRLVAVTTDCHPRLAEELMPELIDRLVGGAVWPLQPPDDVTRLEILKKKSAGSPAIPESVLKFLANSLRGNVRELEGAIHSIRHFAKHTGRPVELGMVREALGDLLRHTVRTVTVQNVDDAVCNVLRLASGALQSKARTWATSHPRMLAIYLCRKHTSATHAEIAKHFGNQTHSAAVAAEKRVRAWIKKDEKLTVGERLWSIKDLLDRLERELQR
jgi:chromosomal replication initiator protein